jgi:hypothetical protein
MLGAVFDPSWANGSAPSYRTSAQKLPDQNLPVPEMSQSEGQGRLGEVHTSYVADQLNMTRFGSTYSEESKCDKSARLLSTDHF